MKKLILFLALLLVSHTAYAERWICWESTTIDTVTYNRVYARVEGDCVNLGVCTGPDHTGLLASCFEASGTEWNDSAQTFADVDDAQPAGSRVSVLSSPDITTINNFNAAQSLLAVRASAKARYDGQTEVAQALRCLGEISKREFNILRERDRDWQSAIDTALTLAQVKINVAALSTLNDRTLAQLKSSIQACVDDGSVDE